MQIPQFWAKAEGEGTAPDRRKLKFAVWGWGTDEASAKREATSRLQRLLDRVRRGEQIPKGYEYGSRPLREEILERLVGQPSDQPAAILTRNRYGAVVLNAERLLFLDIDVPAEGMFQRIGRVFSGDRRSSSEAALARLRNALRAHGRASFWLYRTAAGYRAIAVDREYDPAGRDAQELMKQSGTDPHFMKLCTAQRSFRARLTPKPWRCNVPLPPEQFPYKDELARTRHAQWVTAYEAASGKYATCHFLEAVGSGKPRGQSEKLIELHDRMSRCRESLPLA